jgi:hypothetical protein
VGVGWVACVSKGNVASFFRVEVMEMRIQAYCKGEVTGSSFIVKRR